MRRRGWLVCHSRYCIKTTKPILKVFPPSGSSIIEAFVTPCADTHFQGDPFYDSSGSDEVKVMCFDGKNIKNYCS